MCILIDRLNEKDGIDKHTICSQMKKVPEFYEIFGSNSEMSDVFRNFTKKVESYSMEDEILRFYEKFKSFSSPGIGNFRKVWENFGFRKNPKLF